MRIAVPILAILLLAGVPGQAREALPEGCTRESEQHILCSWNPTVGVTTATSWKTPLRGLPESIVDLSITPSVPDSWNFVIYDVTARDMLIGAAEIGPYTGVYHIRFVPGHDVEFRLNTLSTGEGEIPRFVPVSYDILLRIEAIAGTQRAETPAGSPADPQLLDARGDARAPRELDIAGAWFDDAVLDDGIFEVGILLPGLANLTAERHSRVRIALNWELLGDRYAVLLTHLPEDSVYRVILSNDFGGWDGALLKNDVTVVALVAEADPGNGTLRAWVPVRGVGDPPPGVRFENLSAAAYYGPPTGFSSVGIAGPLSGGTAIPVDVATEQVRPFALGGPEIWTQLRGLTPLTVAPAAAPWYRDPFSTDNLPDTLQVGGAVLAGLTALWGLVVVRRRREALARLLDDVDAVLEIHRHDREAALASLTRLQERFDALLRKGTISESQHATLQARIEGATGRLMLRRDA